MKKNKTVLRPNNNYFDYYRINYSINATLKPIKSKTGIPKIIKNCKI